MFFMLTVTIQKRIVEELVIERLPKAFLGLTIGEL